MHYIILYSHRIRYICKHHFLGRKTVNISYTSVKTCFGGSKKNCLIETVLSVPTTYVLVVKEENNISINHLSRGLILI